MTMIELSGGVVYPDGDTLTAFLYAPAAPGIATGPDGRAQVNLLTAGPASFLQVTGRWGLTEAEVEALRAELAATLDMPAATLRLRPLPETVDSAALLIGTGEGGEDGEGVFTELQRVKPSGVSPNHAAFNLMLTGDALEAAKAGLEGTRGRLALRYEGTRQIPVTTSASAEERSASEGGGADESGGIWQSSKLRTMAAESRHVTFNDAPFSALLDAADWPRPAGRAPT